MATTAPAQSVTFQVDKVEKATQPLPTCRTYEAVKRLVGSEIESCCDYHGMVVSEVRYQALLAAVYTAFNDHRPLVLGPDEIWITISQGVAQHMTLHAERLRRRFVTHDGRLPLEVAVDEFVKGSPENPWAEAFAKWSGQIRDHVGAETHDLLRCDFSTTGPIEQTASEIVLMDVFERYFHYEAVGICGIPEVTLLGKAEDWEKLQVKVELLQRFDLGWWIDHLRPICAQFVRAAKGNANIEHWRNICKLRSDYGGNVINGWVAKLFPYLREFINGPVRRKNPIFETGEGFRSFDAPSGLSQVPFVWRIEAKGMPTQRYDMEAIGGLLGVEQDENTKALRAKIGWAVRDVSRIDALLNRLAREHATRPGVKSTGLVEDMGKFYLRTDGAELFGCGEVARFRIVKRAEFEQVYGFEQSASEMRNQPPCWVRFCRLADGNSLAIDCAYRSAVRPGVRKALEAIEQECGPRRKAAEQQIEAEMARWLAAQTGQPSKRQIQEQLMRLRRESPVLEEIGARRSSVWRAGPGHYRVSLVILCGTATTQLQGNCPVIAESFTEFLQRTLESAGRYWWLEPSFAGYGNAIQRLRERYRP